jgi:hypothetical protein
MNTKLITYLVGKGGSISAEKNTKGDNPLHLLAQMCMKHDNKYMYCIAFLMFYSTEQKDLIHLGKKQ